MPKKAPTTDSIDPVRSRLAGAVAGPASVKPAETASAQPKEPLRSPDKLLRDEEPPKASETPQRRPKPARSRTQMTVNRKFMVSPQEAERMEETLRAISDSFGSKVTYSQVSRAFWTILSGKEDAFRSSGRRAVKRSVPSTGDAIGMAEYEEAVTEFLEAILRRQ